MERGRHKFKKAPSDNLEIDYKAKEERGLRSSEA
jgi:hypothetical protein